MRHHAKASPAGSTHGTGSSRGLFGRAFATRGASRDANGSGAPSRRLTGLLGLTVLVSGALFGGSALPASAQAACANEAIQLQSNVNPTTLQPYSAGLPECRAYEMVSPQDKHAHDVREGNILSGDGNSFGFNVFGQLPDGEGFNSFSFMGNSFLATRTAGGWGTRATTVSGRFIQRVAPSRYVLDYSTDFSRYGTCGSADGSGTSSVSTVACAVHMPDGSWVSTPQYQALNGKVAGGAGITYGGGSSDLSHLLFFAGTPQLKFLPSDTYCPTCVAGTIYEVAGMGTSEPTLRLVTVDNNGNQFAADRVAIGYGPNTSNDGDSYQAISDDGETIYFSAIPLNGTVSNVYARRGGKTTVQISNPSPAECTTCDPTPSEGIYQGASADGSKAIFLTKQQLVNADTDTTQDLYQYDFNNPVGKRLVQVSGGGVGAVTPGVGADVSGVVRPSSDGSHVYFVAKGVLTTIPNALGAVASPGAANLYVFQRDAANPAGSTKYVATLQPTDSGLWKTNNEERMARTTTDGRFLVFVTFAALTADDVDTASDVYRYDAETGEIVRISIGEPGFPASANGNTPGKNAGVAPLYAFGQYGASATINQHSNPISGDGSYIIFSTDEKLQADDVNNTFDVYLWHAGVVALVSDGQAPAGTGGSLLFSAKDSAISDSGRDIMFATTSRLVPTDGDVLIDAYNARVDGGFLSTPRPVCLEVIACRGPAAPSSTSPVPGSATFSGPGNPIVDKPAKKKRKHKKKKQQQQKKHTTGKRR